MTAPDPRTRSASFRGRGRAPAEPVPVDAVAIGTLEPGDGRWRAFVERHDAATVFHHPRWLEVLAREYRQDAVCLAAFDDAGEVVGVLPLVRTRGLPFGLGGAAGARRLSSLPRTPVAGPIATSPVALRALLRAASAMVDEEPGTLLQVKLDAGAAAGEVGPLRPRRWRDGYVVELPGPGREVRFGSSKRHGRIVWAVRKAEREGVVVQPAADLDDVRRWYRLYLETMRWHAVPARPLRLFEAMWDLLAPEGLMRLLLARRGDGGAILAGSIFLQHGRTAVYAFNGRRADALSLRPNDAILYRAILDAAAAGSTRFDLGEVATGSEGLAEFKAKWGATARPLLRYVHPDPSDAEHTDAEHTDPAASRPGEPRPTASPARAESSAAPDGGAAAPGLVRTLWRRMPLGLTALVGERAYRFL